eukprot:gnl/TRDRNA2_/TRDRNA2_182919_c0_seq1.p1 gnl/TRDRNA2_/TRDRNA2_182919_c0~~gnl/TRDRNA2_/TRDRNA2_182919_c0_seq1.p1  ORF type:complete len:589 (-),score=77.03 gnl/TRDRNA2_/TRDRNA2_182919_c0_seq1:170-1936(-)
MGSEALGLYKNLSKDQISSLQKKMTEKLRTLIGTHGDIAVLVEYISVMLQSARPRHLVEQELEAFLQGRTGGFVVWLCAELEAIGGSGSPGGDGEGKKKRSAGATDDDTRRGAAPRRAAMGGLGLGLLRRAVKDAQRSTEAGDDSAPAKDTAAARPERAERSDRAERPEPPKKKHAAARHKEEDKDSEPSGRTRKRTKKEKNAKLMPRSEAEKSPPRRERSRSRHRNRGASPASCESASSDEDDDGPEDTQGERETHERERDRERRRHRTALDPVRRHLQSFQGGGPPATGAFQAPPPRPRRSDAPPPLRPQLHMQVRGAHAGDHRMDSRSHWSPPTSSLAQTQTAGEDPMRWHFSAPSDSASAGHPRPAYVPHAAHAPQPQVLLPHSDPPTQWLAPAPVAAAPPAPMVAPAPAPVAYPPPPMAAQVPAPGPAPPGPAPVMAAATRPPARPKNFVPQKWRVIRANTVVRASERLDSVEVRTLREGEIVESVAPPFTLANGIVRLQIAHPSSAAYPNPIGWITQDASAAGGPRYLEPGPQPVQAAMRPPRPTAYGGWRPRAKGWGKGGGGGKGGSFHNVVWRPAATPST